MPVAHCSPVLCGQVGRGELRSPSLDFSPGLMAGASQHASFWPLPWQPGNFQTLPACLHHPLNPASTPFHSSGQKCSPALREPGNPPNSPTPPQPNSSLPSAPPKPAFFWKDKTLLSPSTLSPTSLLFRTKVALCEEGCGALHKYLIFSNLPFCAAVSSRG